MGWHGDAYSGHDAIVTAGSWGVGGRRVLTVQSRLERSRLEGQASWTELTPRRVAASIATQRREDAICKRRQWIQVRTSQSIQSSSSWCHPLTEADTLGVDQASTPVAWSDLYPGGMTRQGPRWPDQAGTPVTWPGKWSLAITVLATQAIHSFLLNGDPPSSSKYIAIGC